MTCLSAVKRPMIWLGKRATSAVTTSDSTATNLSPMAMILLMASVSPLPQYWLIITEPPAAKPKENMLNTKNGWLASDDADSCTWPSWPSMMVSIMLTPKPMRFCSAMGMATAMSAL